MKKANIQGTGFSETSIIDSAKQTIFTFNAEGEVIFELPTFGAGFDFWKLPNGNFLYCHLGGEGCGVRVVTPENEIVTDYRGESEIFCCQPLEEGCLLAGELTQKRIVILSPAGKREHIIPVKSEVSGHEVMRAARRAKDGTYLVVHPGDRAIRRYAENGELLWEAQTRNDTFAVVEKEDGHLLYTAQTALVEIDAAGREVWCMTKDDMPTLHIHWLTGMQLLPDGTTVLCNWLGHGREGTGVPLFAVSPDKRVLWTLEAPSFTLDPANVQVGGLTVGK